MQKYYGNYGGTYVPETLIQPLAEIEQAFIAIQQDQKFINTYQHLLKTYAGRPTPFYHAKNLSSVLGQEVYLKREDLLHGGAHKTNNALGQGLLAKTMGKQKLIAETGAGQHGVATAMIGALLNMPVEIYMGSKDVERQQPNVLRMKLFGATVHAVETEGGTLKGAINAALRAWSASVHDTYYVFGTAAGPQPFPELVKYLQKIIGEEAHAQSLALIGKLPDAVFACVGGGSNAIGMFNRFIQESSVALYGAEAAGKGVDTEEHAATLTKGHDGIFHGMHSLFLQNEDGQIQETHSISAGLDYPGIGPEHAYLHASKRVSYLPVADQEALEAFYLLAKHEGILGALESCHAIALAKKLAPQFKPNSHLLINLSGRGDKDLAAIGHSRARGDDAKI